MKYKNITKYKNQEYNDIYKYNEIVFIYINIILNYDTI